MSMHPLSNSVKTHAFDMEVTGHPAKNESTKASTRTDQKQQATCFTPFLLWIKMIVAYLIVCCKRIKGHILKLWGLSLFFRSSHRGSHRQQWEQDLAGHSAPPKLSAHHPQTGWHLTGL